MSASEYTQPPEPERLSAEFEAMNTLLEAYFAFVGPKQATRYLRVIAAALAETGPSNIVSMRDAQRDTEATRRARAWLRERLSTWLARHG